MAGRTSSKAGRPAATTSILPKRILADASPGMAIDVLGIRVVCERVAREWLSGISVATPLVRYLTLHAWAVAKLASRKGSNPTAVSRTLRELDAAIGLAFAFAESPPVGVAGAKTFKARLGDRSSGPWRDAVSAFIRVPPSRTYRAPFELLRLDDPNRGRPLVDAAERSLGRVRFLRDIVSGSSPARWREEDLLDIRGAMNDFAAPADERDALLRLILDVGAPRDPGRAESEAIDELLRRRRASYGLLLHVAVTAPRERLAERGPDRVKPLVEETLCLPSLDSIPPPLRPAAAAWLGFLGRDLLVLLAESTLDAVLSRCRLRPSSTAERSAVELADEVDGRLLEQAALPGDLLDRPIRDLVEAVRAPLEATTTTAEAGMRRWSAPLHEHALHEIAIGMSSEQHTALLLPALVVLGERLRAGAVEVDAEYAESSDRLPMRTWLFPLLDRWASSTRPSRAELADLIAFLPRHHIEVAARRFASNRRTVFLFTADSSTRAEPDVRFKAGRTASRMIRTVGWLLQLGLLDDNGVATQVGAKTLSELCA